MKSFFSFTLAFVTYTLGLSFWLDQYLPLHIFDAWTFAYWISIYNTLVVLGVVIIGAIVQFRKKAKG